MWPYIIIVMNYCTWLIFIQYIQLYSSSLEKRLGRSWMDPCLLGRSSPFHNFLPPFRLNEHWITAITVGNYETVCIILQDYSFRSFVMSLFYSFLPICLLCLTLCGLGKYIILGIEEKSIELWKLPRVSINGKIGRHKKSYGYFLTFLLTWSLNPI